MWPGDRKGLAVSNIPCSPAPHTPAPSCVHTFLPVPKPQRSTWRFDVSRTRLELELTDRRSVAVLPPHDTHARARARTRVADSAFAGGRYSCPLSLTLTLTDQSIVHRLIHTCSTYCQPPPCNLHICWRLFPRSFSVPTGTRPQTRCERRRSPRPGGTLRWLSSSTSR